MPRTPRRPSPPRAGGTASRAIHRLDDHGAALRAGAYSPHEDEAATARRLAEEDAPPPERVAAGARLSVAVWVTAAAPDDVVRFYRDELGIRSEEGTNLDAESLRPGTASPAEMDVETYVEDDLKDQPEHEQMIRRGTVLKAALEKRKPYRKGEWVSGAPRAPRAAGSERKPVASAARTT